MYENSGIDFNPSAKSHASWNTRTMEEERACVLFCCHVLFTNNTAADPPGVVWVNIDYRNCVFRFLSMSTVDMNLSLMS